MAEKYTDCPRCKRPVVQIKDWGPAGKLFIHGEFIENGLPAIEACHVHLDELNHSLRWDHDLRDSRPLPPRQGGEG